MRATLDYNLDDPEDEKALNRALKADTYLGALEEFDEWLRSQIKYHDKEELRPAREHLGTILLERDIHLHEE